MDKDTNFSYWNCNLDFDEIKWELLTLFKSQNPLLIYNNSKSIKDKFWLYLNCLTNKITDGFDINDDPKWFMFTIYKKTNYNLIWIRELWEYLKESKNFDILSYFYYVKVLNNDKYCLWIWLMKLKKNESDKNIQDFLIKNNSFFNINYIKKIYNDFNIWKIDFTITLKQDFLEHFLEKIYLSLNDYDKKRFLDIFVLKIDTNNSDYDKVVKILQKVINNYVSNDKLYIFDKTINNLNYIETKKNIDVLINSYVTNKWNFYSDITKQIHLIHNTDKFIFWQYVKTKLIDEFYPEIKYLFYDYSSWEFLDKDSFLKLKWSYRSQEVISPEAIYLNWEINEIIELKNIIMEINNNLFSFLILPLVYILLSDKIATRKKDLYKLKYLLLFIFSNNYYEYKNIYKFFNQLEVFLNYDNKNNLFNKLQVVFSLLILFIIWLIFIYNYLPFWIFVWLFLLFIFKYIEVIYPEFYYKQKWNIWLKFFSISILVISTFFWFKDFNNFLNQTKDISTKIEKFSTTPTNVIFQENYNLIKASLFDTKK